jgi:hypothetical protein
MLRERERERLTDDGERERERDVERGMVWCPLNMMMTCRFAASAGFVVPIPYICYHFHE